jgi:hypothetical protein
MYGFNLKSITDLKPNAEIPLQHSLRVTIHCPLRGQMYADRRMKASASRTCSTTGGQNPTCNVAEGLHSAASLISDERGKGAFVVYAQSGFIVCPLVADPDSGIVSFGKAPPSLGL